MGLTETRPTLLWSRAAQPDPPAGLGPWRDRLAALRPRYYRLLVDWAAIQPDPARLPDWTVATDGCERGRPPCQAFAGIRDVLRAVASQQQAAPGTFEVLVSIYGVPAWAAAPRLMRSHLEPQPHYSLRQSFDAIAYVDCAERCSSLDVTA